MYYEMVRKFKKKPGNRSMSLKLPVDMTHAITQGMRANKRQILISLMTGIVSLLILCFIFVCFYFIYIIFSHASLRPFSIGHTEKFEDFMATGMNRLHANLKVYGGEPEFMNLFFPPASGNTSFQPHDLPDLYIMFMFHEALSTNNANELSSLIDFLPASAVSQYYIPDSRTTIGTYDTLKNNLLVFDAFRKSISNTVAEMKQTNSYYYSLPIRIAVFDIDMFVNDYFNAIVMAYDLRKSGRINSFVIFKIYMRDITNYVFYETIPNAWQNFMADVESSAESMKSFMSSETMASAVQDMPFVIAGIQENFTEHFGMTAFFGSFIHLAEAMLNLITSLLTAISNPVAFLRILIGIVVGLIIYILYIVLLAISPLFIVPAFIIESSFKLLITVIWTALFCVIAVVYLICWLGDIVTNGFVFSLMRCENLPSAWHTQAGYAKKNVYTREFLCCSPCGERYDPTSWLCRNIPTYVPGFCPQQLIYSKYMDGKDISGQFKHEFIPPTTYYSKHPDARKYIIGEIYDAKEVFETQCKTAMGSYDHITRDICALCEDRPDMVDVMTMCQFAYCNDRDKPSYCGGVSITRSVDEHTDLVNKILLILITSTMFLILFRMLHRSSIQA